jgi:hypothetical protein
MSRLLVETEHELAVATEAKSRERRRAKR